MRIVLFLAPIGIRFQTSLEGLYLTPFYDIGYSWYENKEYQSENHYFMNAMGMQILYTRSANFYVKMDAARAVHRFKHDGEHRARVYVSLGNTFNFGVIGEISPPPPFFNPP
ncbi:TPA: hypothetical protein ACYKEX_000001, partial [Campylobacter jejuni]